MSSNKLDQQTLNPVELNALAMQMISHVRDDQTLPTQGIYRRLVLRLKVRMMELGMTPQLPLQDVTDWLAVALFLDDREYFHSLCQQAKAQEDPVHRRAAPWLTKIIEHDNNAKPKS